jgi:pyrimidine-nucleoside phosphorylase
VRSQGGDPEKLLEMRNKYRSPVSAEIHAARDGFISRIDAWKIGHAAVLLGVGRNRTEDPVCPTAGVEFRRKRDSWVKAGEKIMDVWAADETRLRAAVSVLPDAIEYSDDTPAKRRLVLKEIS